MRNVMENDSIDISNDAGDLQKRSTRVKKSRKPLLLTLLAIVLLAVVAAGAYKWYGQISEYQMKQNESDKQISELQKKVEALEGGKAPSTALTESVTVDGGDKQFTLKYPSGWTVVKTSHNTELSSKNTTVEDASIASPSKDIVIKVQTGISGIGGACIASENPSWILDVFSQSTLTGATGYSFMEYNSVNQGRFGSDVVQTSAIKDVKQGANICDIAFVNYMDINSPNGAVSIGISSVKLQPKLVANKPVSQSEIKAYFASDEYKVAKTIVSSLMVK